MAQLLDLDTLAEKIIVPETRTYFMEAVSAYRAGALRSSIGTLWVAICVDIIEKIRELAMMGEQEAVALAQRFQSFVENSNIDGLLKFERELLGVACTKLELISAAELRHFERIKEDRNQAMHPSFRPEGTHVSFSPELVRSHLVHAATLLFSVPPTKGKSVIEGIYALVAEESFPQTVDEAYIVLSSRSHLERAKDSTIRNLIITFLKRMFVDDEPIDVTVVERFASALGAIERIHNKIAVVTATESLNKLLPAQNKKKIRRLIGLVAFIPTYWDRLDRSIRVRAKGSVRTMSFEDFRKYRVIFASEHIRELQIEVKTLINSFDTDDRRKALSLKPLSYLVEDVIFLYSSSGSFDFANSAGNTLIRYANFLSATDITSLLSKIFSNQKSRINQVLSSSGAEQVFSELARLPVSEDQRAAEAWAQFFNKLKEIGYDLELLNLELEKKGIIAINAKKEKDSETDEIPF